MGPKCPMTRHTNINITFNQKKMNSILLSWAFLFIFRNGFYVNIEVTPD